MKVSHSIQVFSSHTKLDRRGCSWSVLLKSVIVRNTHIMSSIERFVEQQCLPCTHPCIHHSYFLGLHALMCALYIHTHSTWCSPVIIVSCIPLFIHTTGHTVSIPEHSSKHTVYTRTIRTVYTRTVNTVYTGTVRTVYTRTVRTVYTRTVRTVHTRIIIFIFIFIR